MYFFVSLVKVQTQKMNLNLFYDVSIIYCNQSNQFVYLNETLTYAVRTLLLICVERLVSVAIETS